LKQVQGNAHDEKVFGSGDIRLFKYGLGFSAQHSTGAA
jgi:hypothetical protein